MPYIYFLRDLANQSGPAAPRPLFLYLNILSHLQTKISFPDDRKLCSPLLNLFLFVTINFMQTFTQKNGSQMLLW
jgi:hypothetical protein